MHKLKSVNSMPIKCNTQLCNTKLFNRVYSRYIAILGYDMQYYIFELFCTQVYLYI